MKIPQESFFDKLKLSIDDLIDDEQLSIGRVGHPFIVPKGYFVQLFAEVNQRVDLLIVPTAKSVKFIPKVKVWYSAAAILLIGILFTFVYFQSPTTTSVNGLSQDDIIAYFEVEPINYNELSSSVEFTEQDIVSLTNNYLPEMADYDNSMIESSDVFMEEIKQLNEK